MIQQVQQVQIVRPTDQEGGFTLINNDDTSSSESAILNFKNLNPSNEQLPSRALNNTGNFINDKFANNSNDDIHLNELSSSEKNDGPSLLPGKVTQEVPQPGQVNSTQSILLQHDEKEEESSIDLNREKTPSPSLIGEDQTQEAPRFGSHEQLLGFLNRDIDNDVKAQTIDNQISDILKQYDNHNNLFQKEAQLIVIYERYLSLGHINVKTLKLFQGALDRLTKSNQQSQFNESINTTRDHTKSVIDDIRNNPYISVEQQTELINELQLPTAPPLLEDLNVPPIQDGEEKPLVDNSNGPPVKNDHSKCCFIL